MKPRLCGQCDEPIERGRRGYRCRCCRQLLCSACYHGAHSVNDIEAAAGLIDAGAIELPARCLGECMCGLLHQVLDEAPELRPATRRRCDRAARQWRAFTVREGVPWVDVRWAEPDEAR